MAIEHYYLGCPAWGLASWVGVLFPEGERGEDRLARYAEVFNAVEGNTTFYALPTPEVVARWASATPETFRFCFKLPRAVTHERMLVGAEEETKRFIELLAPLGARLGPFMIQLPPSFGPSALGDLERFLDTLPPSVTVAVEVRHRGFFEGEGEKALDDSLRARRVDRVVLDTRGLFSADRGDRRVAAVQSRKPRLPVRARALHRHPIIRFVPHPDYAANRRFLDGWRASLRSFLDAGLEPFFFMHAPDDRHAPDMARRFHRSLRDAGLSVGRLPAFLGDEAADRPQLQLFEG